MEGDVTTQLTQSDNLLENMDCTRLNSAAVTMNDTIFPLNNDDNISDQKRFRQIFASRYSLPLPSLFLGSLDQALTSSLYDPQNPRPLVIYIHDDRSVAAHIFSELVLCSEWINTYLDQQFTIWPWNLTRENYSELLKVIITYAGEEVAAIIDSSSIDVYPLLICLTFGQGQIKVESIIQGTMSNSEVLGLLIQARDAFDAQIQFPSTTNFNLTNISTENCFIPASTFTEVAKESDEFRRVTADFGSNAAISVGRIDRIENTTWSMHYFNQKTMIDSRVGHNNTEKLLFHGCPYSAAEEILKHGFDHQCIGKNGTSYGHGFYFSSSRSVSDRYALPNPSTGEKTIIMCRVLVGHSCLGNSKMKICPSNYDSTTGELNIHVVYSNRQILPEYLITYK